MAIIYQSPRLQLGDAPLSGYSGSEKDQFALIWQTTGGLDSDRFEVEYRPLGSTNWIVAPVPITIDTGVGDRINHEVTVTGLDYDALYEYRVRHFQENNLVDTYQEDFRTRLAPGDNRRFSFASYGDAASLNYNLEFRALQDRLNQIDPDFGLLLGDNAYQDGTHPEHDARFVSALAPEATDWTADHIDYSTIGNHEIHTDNGQPYLDSYALPIPIAGIDSPASFGEPELNYSFDYGNAHFVTFDSNIISRGDEIYDQLDYVTADLAASDAQWKIAFIHHPLAGSPDKSQTPGNSYYQTVMPALKAAGVDLLLTGHSHTYSWTYPLTGFSGDEATFVQDDDKVYNKGDGLVQVVAGTGGSSLRPGTFDEPFIAAGFSQSTDLLSETGFAHVSVTDEALTVDYVAADDGEIIDSFKIVENGYVPPPNPTPETVSPEIDPDTDNTEPENTVQNVFQQGKNGYTGTTDTYLSESSADRDNSHANSIRVDGSYYGGQLQGLLRFDDIFGTQAGQITPTADIQSAFLELTVNNPGDSIRIYNMRQSWTDTDTWNSFGEGIQTDGNEAAVEALTQTGLINGDVVKIDVTDSLLTWQQNPLANQGWALLPTRANGVGVESSEGSNAPRLVVNTLPSEDSSESILEPVPSATHKAHFSLQSSATVEGVTYRDEDIIAVDANNKLSLLFDGSDVGLSALEIDAMDRISDTEILMSFKADNTITLNGVSTFVDKSDIVKFTATELGNNTAGFFELFFDGSDVGLSGNAENVDGIQRLTNGDLLLSTAGKVVVPTSSSSSSTQDWLVAHDEDLLLFESESLGTQTSGRWQHYFDGSDVGLITSADDINAIALSADNIFHLSTSGTTSISGITSKEDDIITISPSQLGKNTNGSFSPQLFLDGSGLGFGSNDIRALDVF